MVERDYIKQKKRIKKESSRFMPKLMIIVTSILILLFILILFFISKNKPNKPIENTVVKTEPPTLVLPELPQERWTYLKELESPHSLPQSSNTNTASKLPDSLQNKPTPRQDSGHSSPVDNSVQEPSQELQAQIQSSSQWILQCGAFKDRSNAEKLKAKLALTGFISQIEEDKLNLVTVGPYKTKEEANQVLNSLKNNDISTCVLYTK